MLIRNVGYDLNNLLGTHKRAVDDEIEICDILIIDIVEPPETLMFELASFQQEPQR